MTIIVKEISNFHEMWHKMAVLILQPFSTGVTDENTYNIA